MKLIFIHGAHQQHLDAQHLQSRWLNIFQLGLEQLNIELSLKDIDFDFPYYGDLIQEYALVKPKAPLNAFMPQALRNWHLPYLHRPPKQINQKQFLIPLLAQYHEDLSFRAHLYLFSQLAKDHVLREFVLFLNKFPKLHETMLHRYILEVYLYLADPEFIHAVHKRVMPSFQDDEEYIIVAHSLGTVIGYNLLQHLSEKVKIKRFITLASPLSFQVVQSKLQPFTHPPLALQGDWYNFYSSEDYLTTFPLDHQFFNFAPDILNERISTFAQRPHEIIGYLQHPEVIKKIIELLSPQLEIKLNSQAS